MTDDVDLLEPAEHTRLFERRILPQSGLWQKTPFDKPKAIIVGGPAGSGKGDLARAAILELNDDAVFIDAEALSSFHPRIREFQVRSPYLWLSKILPEAEQWANELREAAVHARKNLVLDATLEQGQRAAILINDLIQKGYDVEIRLIAMHKLESLLAADIRFTTSVEVHGFGRHVPAHIHEAIYDALPASLDLIHEQTTANIRMFDTQR